VFEDEPPDLRDLTNQELRELALGPDLWLNSPALAELGDRSPADARLVALDALQREDKLLVATALRVLGDSDLNSAIEYMRRTVSDAPLEVIDAMVDIVAVVHPFGPDSERELLSQLVERLWPPQGSREYNLADLLFRQYPHIRPV
jgi:hypothetical protein